MVRFLLIACVLFIGNSLFGQAGLSVTGTIDASNLTITGTIQGGTYSGTLTNGIVTIANLSATGTPSSTTFLRGDNTWATPAGGGTVTSVSVATANGVSGSVATATTTPAITLTLGAITPSSISTSGAITATGAIQGSSFIRTGGTASQFLKADGSVDANTYITAAGVVTSITGTANNITASASTGAVTLSLPANISGLTSVSSTGFTGALTGNASTASAFATGRTISISGDLTYTSPSFDGSGNVTAAGTLATVNASGVGTFGSATQVPQVVTNAKGLVTSITNVTITPASFSGSLAGDVTGTQSATVVGKINGTSLSGLATGILKNTTGTGVPSIAVSGTDYVLPSGTFFLGTTSIAHNRASAAQSLTGITSIDGSAATLTTGRTISISGDLTYTSPSFDGSGNVTAAGTLATVNASGVGTFGSATQVPEVVTNAKGLVTSITNVTITPAGTSLTGSTLASGITTSSLTSLGTLNGLTVLGPVDINASNNSAVNINTGTSTGTVTIGGTAAQTINLANGATSGNTVVNILSGAGSAGTSTVNIGDNTFVNAIDIGNANAAASRTINLGTGNVATGNTEILNLGNGTTAGTGARQINIGTGIAGGGIATINMGTGATTVAGGNTIHIGDGAPTGSGTNLITMGSTANASTTTIQGGTTGGGISLTPGTAGTIVIGAGAGTGDITLGNSSATQNVNIGTGTGTSTISIGTGATNPKTISIGTGAVGNTITIGNGTSGTAINLNTGAATNLSVSLGTTGQAIFSSSTTNSDDIVILPQSTTNTASFAGTITSADLTAARTWTLPDISGTLQVDLNNVSVADQTLPVNATTQITNGNINIPSTKLKIGTVFKCVISMTKTAAGTVNPIFLLKLGTAGNASDATILTFTLPAGTAVIDAAVVTINITIRGPLSASCIAQGSLFLQNNLASTGFRSSTAPVTLQVTSGAFDATTSGLIASLWATTGATTATTLKQVIFEAINL